MILHEEIDKKLTHVRKHLECEYLTFPLLISVKYFLSFDYEKDANHRIHCFTMGLYGRQYAF